MAISEKRAQLYLPEEQFKRAMRLAKQKRVSFAHLVREAIDDLLRKSERRWDQDPITKHIGLLEGTETDLASNHDHYLYGE